MGSNNKTGNNNKKCSGNNGKRSNNRQRKGKNYNVSDESTNDRRVSDSNQRPNVVTHATVDNDPKWYTNISPLVSDYASVPYSIPNGMPYKMVSKNSFSYVKTDGTKAVKDYEVTPGIMALDVAPIMGISVSDTSAPNLAAQQLYTKIRKANSGAINYDKTDVMMTVLAMDSAYMLYETLLRAYRMLGTYSAVNRYLPDGLLYASGFSPALAEDLTAFRGILDLFAYKLVTIPIPDQFDFIHRHSWLFTNVYKDDDINRAQLYLYKPSLLYVWTEGASSEELPYLKATPFLDLFETNGQPVSTLAQITKAIDKVMTPILGSQDIGTIAGDIMKAFGDAGMIQIKPAEDYAWLEPVYSEEVLIQMANASFLNDGYYWEIKNWHIKVEPSNTITGPYLTQKLPLGVITSTGSTSGHFNDVLRGLRNTILNMPSDNVTPELNMVATRLCFTIGVDPDVENGFCIESAGTEVVTRINIWTAESDKNGNCMPMTAQSFVPLEQNRFTGLSWKFVSKWSKFKYKPTIYMFDSSDMSSATPVVWYEGHLQDDSNYTVLTDDQLRRMNDVAIMSEYTLASYELTLS